MTRTAISTVALAALLAVGGLAQAHKKPAMGAMIANARSATATLKKADGTPVGTARVLEVAGGLRLTVTANGLTEGTHGAHIHTTGKCDAPDFASAGGHWNPGMTKHGSMNPAGPHAGDLPNLVIARNGKGTVAVNLPGATFDGLMDADGAALVIHAGADDLMTDPSGNSGGRIACGVFAAG